MHGLGCNCHPYSGEAQCGGGACSSDTKGASIEVLQLQWLVGVAGGCLTWPFITTSTRAMMASSCEEEERRDWSPLSGLVAWGTSFAREKLLVHWWTSRGEILWCAQCIIHHYYTMHDSLLRIKRSKSLIQSRMKITMNKFVFEEKIHFEVFNHKFKTLDLTLICHY